MKVLHITNAYPYNEYSSYGIFIKEQIRSLAELSIDTSVLFINARKHGNLEYFKSVKNIKHRLKKFKPDIIHCHHEFSLLPVLFANMNTPVLLSLLGDIKKRSKLNQILFSLMNKVPNHIIIKNSYTSKEGYTYLPNGVNFSLFQEINEVEAKRKINVSTKNNYVLFVSASLNNPVKRYDKYLNVIQKLNQIHEIHLTPLILSGVPRNLVPYYYNASKFLLLTSDHEGSPNAVKEAMACNLPVVSTDVGNVKLLFSNTKGLYLSEKGTEEELVRKCIDALKVDKSKGRERLQELGLDMKSIGLQLKHIYNQMIN